MIGKRRRKITKSDYPPARKNKIDHDDSASRLLANINLFNEYFDSCIYSSFYRNLKFKLHRLWHRYQYDTKIIFPDMPSQEIIDHAWELVRGCKLSEDLRAYGVLLNSKILNFLKTEAGRKMTSQHQSYISGLKFGAPSQWLGSQIKEKLIHRQSSNSVWRRFCEYFNLPVFLKIPLLGTFRLYVTAQYRHPEDKVNHSKEASRIFFSTIVERLKGTFWDARANFFRKNQNNEDCYRGDIPLNEGSMGEFTSYWVGHATCYMNIPVYDTKHRIKHIRLLTDPVEGSLNKFLYPRRTEVGCRVEELPGVDIVLITHDHRDHLDERTLEKLLPLQPLLIVPEGAEGLVSKMGFKNVRALLPGQGVELCDSDGFRVATINANVARHWSGRFVHDAHASAFLSYIIQSNALNERDIFFAGDTALLSEEEVSLMGEKFFISYLFQPGGPDENRIDMESTHQSSADGLLIHTRLLKINIARLSMEPNDPVRYDDLNEIVKTIYMHNKTFKLGNLHHDDTDLSISRVLNALLSVRSYKIRENSVDFDTFSGRKIYLSTLKPYEYNILTEILKLLASINVIDADNKIRPLTPKELCELFNKSVSVPKIGEKLAIGSLDLPLSLLDHSNIINENALQECIDHFASYENLADENAILECIKTLFDKYNSKWWHAYTREHCDAEISQLKNSNNLYDLSENLDNLVAKQGAADSHLASYLLFCCNQLAAIGPKQISHDKLSTQRFSFRL
ncbi:MAG: MBL fold metallo-hydrolase [Gammaproteobacteria bacterium]